MLKQKEQKILACLRADARVRLTEISKKTQVPVSTIHDKLKGRYDGIITKMTALLDFRKLGYTARACIILKVKRSDREGLQAFLERNEAVNNLFKINNGYDFMIEGVFKYLQDLENFTEELEDKFQIEEKQVFYIIDDIRREMFMSV